MANDEDGDKREGNGMFCILSEIRSAKTAPLWNARHDIMRLPGS